MAFSFGFSGDDIDIDDVDINEVPEVIVQHGTDSLPELVQASKHDMNEWLSVLPSQIFFNRLVLNQDAPVVIARREIYDIRTQLMAEDSVDHDNAELIAGIEEGDLKPNFYEGGFKTWECALDLAKLVTGESTFIESLDDPQTNVHIIELGAGTAVPSLAIFAHLLKTTTGTSQCKTHFTFADYNSSVLRLVTLPNLLLTWWNSRQYPVPSAVDEQAPQVRQEEEELDITPELLNEFQSDIAQRGISIDLISGAWSPEFVDLAFSTRDSDYKTLLLASETIYSPSSLVAFSETISTLLYRSSTASIKARALVAAKKVYFGVGGGVDEFLAVLKNSCEHELEVLQRVDVQSEGVGRVVLEITPATVI
ncbi:hypothetical protein N7495_002920 [Penicillium taxi]|uniref:uncharacterized protein n=1 Tax=Penicillium taxi TaxID=168475 RepID=UPI002545ABBC|nr:uncharacterized protein N7495_002920 [Penicillium taxi]KAJ5902392.1 hypothetical protein N7495_002920 [Penicillium taxi]